MFKGVLQLTPTEDQASGTPLIEASRISAMCAVRIVTPWAASAAEICSVQPGLAEMSREAPEAATESALRDPSADAASGCSRL